MVSLTGYEDFQQIHNSTNSQSIQYGNTLISASAYAAYGAVTCNHLQDVDTGIKFGSLALQLISKLNAKVFKPEVLHVVGSFLVHRKSHLKKTLPLLQEEYADALEIGNLEYVGYSASLFCFHSFWCGQPLANLEQEARTYCHRLVQVNQLTTANYCRVCLQYILTLLGVAEQPNAWHGEVFQELYLFHLHKLMLCYLFDEIESARDCAVEIRHYLVAGIGTLGEPVFYFYDSLIALAASSSHSEERAMILERVEQNQKQLQQQWAYYAPMNYQHKVDLVQAEKMRLLGQKVEAIELYNKAISGAKANEYIQDEALANELAAKFYLNWNQEKVARVYMMDAHYCYSRWGATAKVKHLEDNYPQLCQSPIAQISVSTTFNSQMTRDSTGSPDLDLTTVIKSTNAISSEIVLEKLLSTLMNILVENAGAERGILILLRGDRLWVEASKERESESVSILESLPIEKFERLASKIVNYVARTGETVVLNDATHEGNFTNDAYIQQYQCQSIACTPLINQSKIQGIIYLENNLTTGAFTKERMALLRTLATQAAISLENARLYNNITTLNKAYERFIPAQFLGFLEKESIVDVTLGDQVEREMTVLFSDIRDFTTLSEQMTPAENFAFINEYLGYMEPQIQKYGGFIDKYIGDAIMALFANSADDAVKGSLAMLEALKKYNSSRQKRHLKPLCIGIGLHTGRLMLGTVGGLGRMDGTAIGDAVNLSSRVEGFTKTYGVSLLMTHQTLLRLNNPLEYDFRFIEKVTAKGKAKAVGLFEVFSADPPDLRAGKIASKGLFERGVIRFHQQAFPEAARLFRECLQECLGDRAARSYLERCDRLVKNG